MTKIHGETSIFNDQITSNGELHMSIKVSKSVILHNETIQDVQWLHKWLSKEAKTLPKVPGS